jgi:hypothetical protein
MKKSGTLSAILSLLISSGLFAQTVYVEVSKGTATGTGTIMDPVSSLEKAISLATGFSGKEPVTIKIGPGLYTLNHLAEVRTGKVLDDTVEYRLEATIMPDDPDWQPEKMPVIQSVSPDNTITQFTHSAGLLIAKSNVRICGLKFIGNGNPMVKYYYPITRENEAYKELDISQCYFIGEKNSAAIQGAIFAHGAGIHVDHSIFYECKNALLLFRAIKDFSLTNSIIYGSYESAVWFGPFDSEFLFSNNIVSHCNYFWVRPEHTAPKYVFSNSLITENDQYLGFYSNKGLIPATKNEQVEKNVRKTGKLLLSEVKTEGLPKDYLNLAPESDGKEIGAGIFKNVK